MKVAGYITRYWKELLTLMFGVTVWLFWNNLYWGHLMYQEQLQLFLFDMDYLWERVAIPGGFVDYVSEFLTQFFYVTSAGAFVIALLMMLMQRLIWAIAKHKEVSDTCYIFSFVPVFLLWAVQSDENLLLSYSVALLFLLLAIRLSQLLDDKWPLQALLIPVLYFLAGPVHFMLALWLVLQLWRKHKWTILAFPLLACLCPYLSSFVYHYHIQQLLSGVNFYRVLDEFPLVLVAVESAFVLVPWLLTVIPEKINLTVSSRPVILFFCLFFLAGFWLVYVTMDEEREDLLQYNELMYEKKWKRIISKAEQKSPENAISVSALNMALCMNGQLTNRMFEFHQYCLGGLFPLSDKDYIISFFTSEVYYHLGMINESQRFAFEAMEGIKNHRKSARSYKRLAETNIINGDFDVAAKYLRALQKTLYYRGWAERAMRCLHNDEMTGRHPEWGWMREVRFKEDFIASPDIIPAMLVELTRVNGRNLLALEYLIAYMLLEHNFEALAAYVPLLQSVGYAHLPRSYQEALAYYWQEQGNEYTDIPWPVDKSVFHEMEDFVRVYNTASNPKEALASRYGKSYWYYLLRISE